MSKKSLARRMGKAASRGIYVFNYPNTKVWDIYIDNWVGVPYGINGTKRHTVNLAYDWSLRKNDSSLLEIIVE